MGSVEDNVVKIEEYMRNQNSNPTLAISLTPHSRDSMAKKLRAREDPSRPVVGRMDLAKPLPVGHCCPLQRAFGCGQSSQVVDAVVRAAGSKHELLWASCSLPACELLDDS